MKVRHHMQPLSLQGFDHHTNIVFVTEKEHTIIHKTLNIPYDRIRAFRKATNHILCVNEYYLEELIILQMDYFGNFAKLPKELQIVHLHCIERMCEFYSKEWKIPYVEEHGTTIEETFFNNLRLWYGLLKKHVYELQNM